MTAIVLLRVEPIGTRKTPAFVDYADGTGELKTLDRPVYPASPDGEAFRRLRVERGVSLREAARRLGISPADVSGLEFGRVVPRDGWTVVRECIGGSL